MNIFKNIFSSPSSKKSKPASYNSDLYQINQASTSPAQNINSIKKLLEQFLTHNRSFFQILKIKPAIVMEGAYSDSAINKELVGVLDSIIQTVEPSVGAIIKDSSLYIISSSQGGCQSVDLYFRKSDLQISKIIHSDANFARRILEQKQSSSECNMKYNLFDVFEQDQVSGICIHLEIRSSLGLLDDDFDGPPPLPTGSGSQLNH